MTGKDIKHEMMEALPARLAPVGQRGSDWAALVFWADGIWAGRAGHVGCRTMLKLALRTLMDEGVVRQWEIERPHPDRNETGQRFALTDGQPSRMSGAELLARRRGLGMSQPELARLLGVTQASVGQWETDRRPIPHRISQELAAVETDRDQLQAAMVTAAEANPGLPLVVWKTDQEFWTAHPDSDGLPVSVQQAAAGRAQQALAKRGMKIDVVFAKPLE